MSISTNKTLNKIIIYLGKMSGGTIDKVAIRFLYFGYRCFPPEHVKKSKVFFDAKKKEVAEVLELLDDDESKRIYKALIDFRGSYDLRIHPGFTNDANFVRELVRLKKGEVFVDCGAYNGDTIKGFLQRTDCFKKIIAFEPDPENYSAAVAYVESLNENIKERIHLYKKGVGRDNANLFFLADGNEGSKVVDQNNGSCITIECVSLDSIVDCKGASFIKMDIEGAEMGALEGAQNLIRMNKPKLAISIYHKDTDMIDIPLYIHELVPDYKMYVRQHSHSFYDTVLYCVAE